MFRKRFERNTILAALIFLERTETVVVSFFITAAESIFNAWLKLSWIYQAYNIKYLLETDYQLTRFFSVFFHRHPSFYISIILITFSLHFNIYTLL